MLEQLRRGRGMEVSENDAIPFLTTDDFKGSLAGLYSRGLLNTEMTRLNGKRIMKVYITTTGINFLERYENEKEKVQA